jgi:F-type H+-transporting ATPase subunit epsilon
MADTFTLQVVTPRRTVFDAEVVSVVVPGADGYFGVMAHHAAMLAEIGTGCLRATLPDGASEELAVSGGFMKVLEDCATILADSAERARDIDVERAREAAERARERLQSHDAHVDVTRAQAALDRALNRLRVAGVQ